MGNNTRGTGVLIPEELEEAARREAGYPDASLGALIRAGLRLLAASDPDVVQEAIASSYLKPGPKQKVH